MVFSHEGRGGVVLVHTCIFIWQFSWIHGTKGHTGKALSGFRDLLLSINFCAVRYRLCARG